MFSLWLFILLFLVTIPAMIFSILSWRLRNPVMFWLGVVFTALVLLIYLINFELILLLLMDIDSIIYSIVLLAFLGFPIYFLVSSKMKKAGTSESDVTDDYLNSIIESKEDDIDY